MQLLQNEYTLSDILIEGNTLERYFGEWQYVKANGKSTAHVIWRNEDNGINVLAYVEADPHLSIKKSCVDLGMSVLSVSQILREFELHLDHVVFPQTKRTKINTMKDGRSDITWSWSLFQDLMQTSNLEKSNKI